MANPQPEEIQGYPAGDIHYQFRKKLSNADINDGLPLVGDAVTILSNFNEQINTRLYTPYCNHEVTLTQAHSTSTYTLTGKGWKDIAANDGLVEGLEVDFWAVTAANSNQLCLLMQVVHVDSDEEDHIRT
ncbi:uncharacterized protein LOC110009555 [Jatropha curcas]|uniref:uncharacterized protein LOC110009555 n=1 Tax=Jatropha curcas TaxID=180498 RepID=UPI0009D6FC9F|nr:uncharacterized protein LOC110009555 [Jatropha curcas]